MSKPSELSEDTAGEPRRSPWHDEDWRCDLARRWADQLLGTAYVPMARAEFERRLLDLVANISAALDDDADLDEVGRTVGTRLVELNATGEESLARSLRLLRDSLLEGRVDGVASRVLTLMVALAAGYTGADRDSTLAQQETLKRALLRSKVQTERQLHVSEQRFREMLLTTPVGVAICALDGGIVEVNPALLDTVGYSEEELTDRSVYDLFHPDEVGSVSEAFGQLASGERTQLRERRNLVRGDEDRAWTYVAVSVLRDADEQPQHLVVVVEDLRELSSLQDRLQHQALHDAMTGLPNRQYFRTRLEAALGNLPRGTVLTLYQLGLDGFQLINDGLGFDVGDTMVRAVASRLDELIADEVGLVARIGGTEFAILLKQTPETPDIGSFADRVNAELAEPIYVADHGIATTASMGITQGRVDDSDANELMWQADVALRHAENAGKRQWALFDPDRAPKERLEARLTAAMPGALELGEFEVRYRPLVSMSGGGVFAVEAQLFWQPEGSDPLGHDECLRLAERSGITLCLRDWLMRNAWEQLTAWHREGHELRLVTGLSPNQSCDPDLVAGLRFLVDEGGELDPSWLRVCMPTSALMSESGDAADNVTTLASMGVQTALHGFRASPQELRYLREVEVDAVRFCTDLVDAVHDNGAQGSVEARALESVVPLIHDTAVPIAVHGIDDAAQARWWTDLGCEIGSGSFYGEPVSAAEMTRVLTGDV